jgi:hypothetical protein
MVTPSSVTPASITFTAVGAAADGQRFQKDETRVGIIEVPSDAPGCLESSAG